MGTILGGLSVEKAFSVHRFSGAVRTDCVNF